MPRPYEVEVEEDETEEVLVNISFDVKARLPVNRDNKVLRDFGSQVLKKYNVPYMVDHVEEIIK